MSSFNRLRSEIEPENETTMRVPCEHVLQTSKRALITKLSDLSHNEDEFKKICEALEDFIRDEYRTFNEDLIEVYDVLDPTVDREQPREIQLEKQRQFLGMLLEVMERCRFQVLTDNEWNLATSSEYLFRLPAKVDKYRLNSSLFENFEENYNVQLPNFCDKRYLIFRRGIGVDRKKGHFLRAKTAEIFNRLWSVTFLRLWRWMGDEPPVKPTQSQQLSSVKGEAECYDVVPRLHISNSFKISKFFEPIQLEEPTFTRSILVYSLAERNTVHVKHYTNIPMADMELILPEKKKPKLPLHDWIFLLGSAILAAVLIIRSYNEHHPHRFGVGMVFGILAAFAGYCARVYYTFNENLLEYERLINHLMHDKQLDNGHGTLLHLCEEAIQLEVKEASIAYFVLGSRSMSEKELCQQCNNLLNEHFKEETCLFTIDNFVSRLLKCKVLVKEGNTVKRSLVLG